MLDIMLPILRWSPFWLSLGFEHFHLDWPGAAAVDELVDVGVVAVVDGFGGALPDDFALVDHGDVIGDLAGACHVVGDGDGGGAEALHAIDDELVDDVGHDGIKAGGGFVEEDDFGIGGDGAGQPHALLHAAGKLRRKEFANFGIEADLAEFFDGNFFCFAARHVAALDQAEGDIFPDGQGVKKRAALKQHAEAAQVFIAAYAFQAGDFLAAHLDGAGIGAEDSEDAFQHDGFSGAGAADHHQRMAFRHGKRNAVQHMLGTEALVNILQDNVTLSHRSLRKQQIGEGEVGGENEDGGGDDGIGGGAAHALRAAPGIEAVVAAHDGDDEAEDGGLDQS